MGNPLCFSLRETSFGPAGMEGGKDRERGREGMREGGREREREGMREGGKESNDAIKVSVYQPKATEVSTLTFHHDETWL